MLDIIKLRSFFPLECSSDVTIVCTNASLLEACLESDNIRNNENSVLKFNGPLTKELQTINDLFIWHNKDMPVFDEGYCTV